MTCREKKGYKCQKQLTDSFHQFDLVIGRIGGAEEGGGQLQNLVSAFRNSKLAHVQTCTFFVHPYSPHSEYTIYTVHSQPVP
jgi:hypothetical protein